MANIDCNVQNVNLSGAALGGLSQIALQLKTAGGANVVTTGAAFIMAIAPAGFSPQGTIGGGITPPELSLVTYLSGQTVLAMNAPNERGSYNYVIQMTPSGGTAQLVAQGTLALN